jgi:hypothetical protein
MQYQQIIQDNEIEVNYIIPVLYWDSLKLFCVILQLPSIKNIYFRAF